MINAEEAKKLTLAATPEYLLKIEEGIRKNAALGKYEYYHTIDADNTTIESIVECLETQGFKVTTSFNMGFDAVLRQNIEINWKGEEENVEEEQPCGH